MLVYNSKISTYEIRKILKCFVIDVNATQSSELLGINRNTINRFYNHFRYLIYDEQIRQFWLLLWWDIELDEMYYWWRRRKWFAGNKRWRWTSKQPVFWVYERWWRIVTQLIPNCTKRILQEIIKDHVDRQSNVYTDWWKWYDWLIDLWYKKHYRVNHWAHEFSKWWWVHINWLEAFWSFTKRRLNKFNGVKSMLELHMKECERRYLKSNDEMFIELINLLKLHSKLLQSINRK